MSNVRAHWTAYPDLSEGLEELLVARGYTKLPSRRELVHGDVRVRYWTCKYGTRPAEFNESRSHGPLPHTFVDARGPQKEVEDIAAVITLYLTNPTPESL